MWEHLNSAPFRAPRRRYRQPIFIDPESFAWRPLAAEPGVAQRHLGSFSECETQLDLFRAEAGASLTLRPHSIYFIVTGRAAISGETLERYSAAQTGWNENPILRAQEETQLLHIGLPDLRDLTATARNAVIPSGVP
jgi:hypothetical protein